MITNYATLVQRVVDAAEDDSAEFSAFIPTAIQFAEERMFKELDLPDLETTLTTTCIAGALSVPLTNSADVLEYIQVRDTNSGKTQVLTKKNIDYLEDYWPNQSILDFPKYWGWLVKGPFFNSAGVATPTSPTIRLVPTPDVPLTLSYRGYAKPVILSTTQPKNYFSEKCPQILFAAVMVEMAKFMKAWQQVGVWDADYNSKAAAWNINMARFRGDGQQANNNPSSTENNLKSKSKTTT